MVFCKLHLLKLLVFDADEFNYQKTKKKKI